MPFAESTRSKNETRKRTSDNYVKFTDKYRITLRMLNNSSRVAWKHWIPEANGGRGMMATCPNVGSQVRPCPIEKMSAGKAKDDPEYTERKARPRYMVNVLDRTPHVVCPSCNATTPSKVCQSCGADVSKEKSFPLNRVKILEQGPRLFNEQLNAVEKLQKEELGAEITDYDIVFQTTGSGRDRKITAIPQPPKELSPKDFLDPETGEEQRLFDLDALSEPNTVEEVEAMLRGATIEELNALRGVV